MHEILHILKDTAMLSCEAMVENKGKKHLERLRMNISVADFLANNLLRWLLAVMRKQNRQL